MPIRASCPECYREHNLADRLLGKKDSLQVVRRGLRRLNPEAEAPREKPSRRGGTGLRLALPSGIRKKRSNRTEVRPRRRTSRPRTGRSWSSIGAGLRDWHLLLIGLGTYFLVRGSKTMPVDEIDRETRSAAQQIEADPAPAAKFPLALLPLSLSTSPENILDVVFTSADVGRPSWCPRCRQAIAAQPNHLRGTLQPGRAKATRRNGPVHSQGPRSLPARQQAGITGDRWMRPPLVQTAHDWRFCKRRAIPRLDVGTYRQEAPGRLGPRTATRRRVYWFSFLDADQLFSSKLSGKPTLWKLSPQQAVYTLDDAIGIPAQSPNRRYLASATRKGLVLHEAATGKRLAELSAAGYQPGTESPPAFSTDGKELVGELRKSGVTYLGRWNLTTGNFVGAIPTGTLNHPLLVVGSQNVFSRFTLYDEKLQRPVWEYQVEKNVLLARSGPDGRLWVVQQRASSPETFLAAHTIPDTRASVLLASIKNGTLKPFLGKGATAQVVLAGNFDQRLRTGANDSVERSLIRNGITVGPGGATVRVTLDVQAPGGSLTYNLQKRRHYRTAESRGPLHGYRPRRRRPSAQ